MTGSGTRASRSIVQRAEALLRSLIGVSRAEVCVRTTGGVERVRLVADGGLSNGQIVQNVRSGLLAGLGVVLQPGQIEFIDEGAWPTAQASSADDLPEEIADPAVPQVSAAATGRGADVSPSIPAAVRNDNGHSGANSSTNGRTLTQVTGASGNGKPGRIGNGTGNGNGHEPQTQSSNGGGAITNGNRGAGGSESPAGNGAPKNVPDLWTRRLRSSPPRPRPPGAPPIGVGSLAAAPSARSESTIGARLIRLEGVDLLRQGGRLRCRVVLSAGGDRYSAVADCADEPLAELQLAARATCDALRAADLTQTRFEAATVANLGGGMHVLVALNGWNRGEPVRRSGSAVIRESAEYAAALAVLHALANT